MYTQKDRFNELKGDFPDGCNAVVTKYRTTDGKELGLFDIALAAYEYSCRTAKQEDFVLVIGFKGFKKLTMTWKIQNPVLESITAIESAIEIAKEMTINLRKYYERAQLVRDYPDDVNSILDGIEKGTLLDCQTNLIKVKENTDSVVLNLDETADFIIFSNEEKM